MTFLISPKRLGLLVLKVLVLIVVAITGLNQLPELRYDLGPKQPITINGLEDLAAGRFQQSTFVAVQGSPDFAKAFTYSRYGLTFTYFNIKPYGLNIVVRTYNQVTEEWTKLDRFLGRLRPFEKQPFSYHVRDIYRERMQVEISEDAYFLALDDVPEPSGWQFGAVGFAGLLWLVMFYLFFLHRGYGSKGRSNRLSASDENQEHPPGNTPQDNGADSKHDPK